MSAISYAFYGIVPCKRGKQRTPLSHGKTTCKVILDSDALGLYIVRTTRPNRLLVTKDDVEYEDDAAQSIINSTLCMDFKEFMISAYILPGKDASVLTMTPTEQIKFIETLANSNTEKIKKEIKEKYREIHDAKLVVEGELNLLENQLAEKEILEEPEEPEAIRKGLNLKKKRLELEKANLTLEKLRGECETIQSRLETTRKDEREKKDAVDKIKKLEMEIAHLSKVEDDPRSTATLKKEIETLRKEIEYQRKLETYTKDSKSLKEAIKEFNKSVDEKLAGLEKDVASEEEIDELVEQIEQAEEDKKAYDAALAERTLAEQNKESARKKIAERFKLIKASITDVAEIKTPSKMIVALLSIREEAAVKLKAANLSKKKRMCCPWCSKSVVLDDDATLVAAPGTAPKKTDDGNYASTISIIDRHIEELKSLNKLFTAEVPPSPDEVQDPMGLHKALMKTRRIKNEYDELQKRKLPVVLEKMKIRVAALEKELAPLKKPIDIATLEGTLREKTLVLDVVTKNHKEYEESQKTITAKKRLVEKLTLLVGDITKIKSVELEAKLSELTRKVMDVNSGMVAIREILDDLADYEAYQKYLGEISEIEKKIEKTKKRMAFLSSRMEGFKGLEEASKEAEILALEETVKSINEHARIYIDQMFDEPISVRLSCVTDKGKQGIKLQMKTIVECHGEIYNDFSELSSGEEQRCVVAFLLGVSEMIGNNSVLLLDECFNNTGDELNQQLLELVKDMRGQKLVLIVAHEAVKGVFDTDVAL